MPLFNDQIISLYSRGMTTRDIQSHLKEIYDVDVSAELISNVTDAVHEDVRAWLEDKAAGEHVSDRLS